ncbi:hypothetical protein [Flavobacterium gilvum]|uniref:Thioredoxin domain-containing protein n=1 Tax=Flavobacterium gilvum TaxID=1492737 RepID=A0AAC9I1S4_9FLAO|nr:hypothetical protein [Flavobacterium gilvum]AOW08524.1 hypothetical protein EM308_02865 [Flavobacterium gilvum]KFC58242.1 hypothetical protein FEM08_30120 [Flavobacterium gilvum]
MKTTLQIIGIASFFAIIGYVLTYPYELSYSGEKDIILIEDSHDISSVSELTHRDEFKNKVLYIKIWEPDASEIFRYTQEDLKKLTNREKSFFKNDITTNDKESNEFIANGGILKYYDPEDQFYYQPALINTYKNKDIVFVYLTAFKSDFEKKEDKLRRWKSVIKRHKIEGCHIILSYDSFENLKKEIPDLNEFNLPHNLIVDKKGVIINYNAPNPRDKELLFPELDAALKTNL